MVDGRPLLSPYSMASAHYNTVLEFLSVKMAERPTDVARLRHIAPGAAVLIGRSRRYAGAGQPAARPHALCFCYGTGLAPFLGLVKDPDLYTRFDRVVLTHTSWLVNELVHAEHIAHELPA